MFKLIKSIFIYTSILILFIICMPLSWYVGYTLSGIGGLVLSLVMPTYGLAALLVYEIFGRGFWQAMLAFPVAVIGAGISIATFSFLMEINKPSQ